MLFASFFHLFQYIWIFLKKKQIDELSFPFTRYFVLLISKIDFHHVYNPVSNCVICDNDFDKSHLLSRIYFIFYTTWFFFLLSRSLSIYLLIIDKPFVLDRFQRINGKWMIFSYLYRSTIAFKCLTSNDRISTICFCVIFLLVFICSYFMWISKGSSNAISSTYMLRYARKLYFVLFIY